LNDLASLFVVLLVDVNDNGFDQFFALVDESVVKFVALDEEHAHADLVGRLSLDLGDRVEVDLDALNVCILVALWLRYELLHPLRLFQDEEVLIVDVHSFGCDLKVLEQDLIDFISGVGHDFVVLSDLPEVCLVRVCDLGVGARDLVDGLDHLLDHLHQVILH